MNSKIKKKIIKNRKENIIRKTKEKSRLNLYIRKKELLSIYRSINALRYQKDAAG